MFRSRLLRFLLPGMLIPFALAILAFVLPWTGGETRESDVPGVEATEPPHDILADQSKIFVEEVERATAWAIAHPSPTPTLTPTPEPSPYEIAVAELPYAVAPEGVAYGPEEHWIGVNVSTQRTYAFVGGTAIHVALVTTGMPGYETPLGEFRINYRKEVDIMDSETMGVPHDDPEGYYLEDIYYAQYFYPAIALHSNYWRPTSYFGRVASSHGCIGMLYDDARFFWDFATYGTRVVVYE